MERSAVALNQTYSTGTQDFRAVAIGEMVVSECPADVLVAYGVGSCVAVCMYDPIAKVGGMLHALLPSAKSDRAGGRPTKFVDQGIPILVNELLQQGAKRPRIAAYLTGGAQVLNAPGFDTTLNIGERNIEAAERGLKEARIPIKASATGGSIGRTVKLYIADGQVTLRSLEHRERPLC